MCGLVPEIDLEVLVPVDLVWGSADEASVHRSVVRLHGLGKERRPVSSVPGDLETSELLAETLDGGVQGGPRVLGSGVGHAVVDLLFVEIVIKLTPEFVAVVGI